MTASPTRPAATRPTAKGGARPDPSAERTVLDYVHAVRDRWTRPLSPPGFVPDWADRPSPHTHHPAADRLALPLHRGELTVSDGAFDLSSLASFLQLSAGPVARRWRIDWSPDTDGRESVTGARWGRGTASGGGAYPVELLWAAGPSAPVPAGVYHYASGLHALEALRIGDPSPRIRAALDGARDREPRTDQFLLCTVRFWKTAYKYSDFAYHLMLHDLGAFLGSWDALCQETGLESRPRLSFDDAALADAAGTEPGEGAVLAVLPLPWATGGDGPYGPGPDCAPVGRARHERSVRTRRFDRVAAVHRATSGRARPGTPPSPAPEPARSLVPLPTGPTRRAALVDAFAVRTSANGLLNGARPLPVADLGAVLHEAAGGLRTGEGGPQPTGLRLSVRNVEAVAPGVYDYLPERHALVPVPGVRYRPLDERVYSLSNYSVGQAAVTLVPNWQPEHTVRAAGARAYRRAAVEAGATCQLLQLAAARRGLASGVVLGFDGPVLEAALGLDREARHGLLCLFLGPPQEGAARLDDRLY
ncbi:nitroreductase family protein [Streptomyces sp. CA-294286]|uniref:nitroreductase family protein n=1 Tax=Streptomyces sp. CA-294286 TaxID=3240070 RepID=UPI003D8BF9F3